MSPVRSIARGLSLLLLVALLALGALGCHGSHGGHGDSARQPSPHAGDTEWLAAKVNKATYAEVIQVYGLPDQVVEGETERLARWGVAGGGKGKGGQGAKFTAVFSQPDLILRRWQGH